MSAQSELGLTTSVYLIWFVLLAQGLSAYSSLSATIFAAYALTEVVFSIYTTYLIRFVQASSPPSALSPEKRNELLRKIITADLAYERPIRPRPIPGDLDRDFERKLWEEYELGHITAAEWHHIQDREYEALHGINERFMQRRVGKMTVREREVLDAFVEESEGDRDERLRKEIERDVGQGWDDFDDEGIIGREGEIRMLHQMDQRAVEFRERLRTWSVAGWPVNFAEQACTLTAGSTTRRGTRSRRTTCWCGCLGPASTCGTRMPRRIRRRWNI